MLKLFAQLAFSSVLLLTSFRSGNFGESANAGPIEDSVAAYDRKDQVIAAKLMRVAADQGNALAQNSLGGMSDEGQAVTQD